MTDTLTSEIRRLSVGRRRLYSRARVARGNGQLIPASLCHEIAENEAHLRRALERYTGGLDHR
jgi:hypothetical protein